MGDQEETSEPKTPGPEDGGVTGTGISRPAASYNDLEERPHPEHPDKPSSPTKLEGVAVRQALKRTLAEFSADNCTGLAAGLTYYAVFAIFPAIIALLSLLGVVGQADKSIDAVLDILRPLVSQDFLTNQIRPFVENLATARGAGVGLAIGIVLALLSASGYVAGFRQAMNTILEVEEGRPIWVLRPLQFLITLIAVVLLAAALVILVVSGKVADSVGSKIGVGDQTVLIWNIAKWPVLLVIVVAVVALLYYATPNVRQPRIRWVSVGAFVAIVVWLVASVGFAFYVANFGSYNKTYGSLAFVIIALLWIWLTNVALLLGAELDSELERVRELQAGIAAEEQLQLPVRDDRGIKKAHAKREQLLERARDLRRAR